MYESTEVNIYTYFLKLNVHIIGNACPIITNMINALKYTSGIMNYSFPCYPLYISTIIEILFTTSNVITIRPYIPRIVELK
jgi:hypothetical protein